MSKTVYTKEKRDPQIQWYDTKKGKRWRVKFSINKNGKRHYIEQSGFISYNDARSGKVKLIDSIDKHLNTKGGKETVSDYWEKYSSRQIDSGIWRNTTATRQQAQFKNKIKPYFGDTPLEKVTRIDIQDWVNELAKNNRLAESSIRTTLKVFSAMLQDAFINDLIPKNPVLKIHVSGKESKDQSITREQYAKVVDYIYNSPKLSLTKRCMAILTLYGLRNGEIRGLKVKDIYNDHIHIGGQLTELHEYTMPKTPSSIRDVPLTEETSALLKQLIVHDRKKSADKDFILSKNDFIFTTPNCRSFHHGTLNNIFDDISNEVGTKIWPHKMRHAFATFAFDIQGANPKDIMNILGHSKIDMSLKYNQGTDEGSQHIISEFSKEIL